MTRFVLQPQFDVQIVPIGRSREPVVLIDNILGNWKMLATLATRQQFSPADQGRGGYPGVRAPLPSTYVKSLQRRVNTIIQDVFFGGEEMTLTNFECSFSLVTTPPKNLHPLQRIPHIDIANPNRIAMQHFLCGEHFGGTAFYRQLATGFEQVSTDDRDRYLDQRLTDLSMLASKSDYPGKNLTGYQKIASFDALPNRLIIYRSYNLHSGIIRPNDTLSSNPLSGRLTANFFMNYIKRI